MTAIELRIGNMIQSKVKDTWNQWEVRPGDIEQIFFSEIPEIYAGIPLTEEWLLKFGFKITKNNAWCKRFGPSSRHFLIQENLFFKFGTGSSFTKIEYIHQLQNLYFALTGTELTQTA